MSNLLPRSRHRQRAQVFVLFPITVLVILGVAAIAIDTGRLMLARKEMQKAAEGAALAGALAAAYAPDQTKSGQQAAADQAARSSISMNMGVADTVCASDLAVNVPQMTSVAINAAPVNVVQVSISCNARWIAGAVMGGRLSIPKLQANAAAAIGSSDPLKHTFTTFDPALPPYPLVLNSDDL